MPLSQTDRLGLPLLAAGQAQKEVAHNEALLRIDLAIQIVVESADLATPPDAPAAGQCWIVAASAAGDWAGQGDALAGWTDNGWRFVAPRPHWHAWVGDRALLMRYDGMHWVDGPVRDNGYFSDGIQILSTRQPAIADPSGGTTIDVAARAAISALLATLRTHGLIES